MFAVGRSELPLEAGDLPLQPAEVPPLINSYYTGPQYHQHGQDRWCCPRPQQHSNPASHRSPSTWSPSRIMAHIPVVAWDLGPPRWEVTLSAQSQPRGGQRAVLTIAPPVAAV